MIKRMFGALAGAGMMLAASTGAASAQADGDYYTFDLHNETSGYTILTFQTGRPNGTYSQDWMPTRVLEAGDSVAMRFYDSEDACEYWVKVVFDDGDEFEQKLDFCELEYVVVTDEGISGTMGD